LDEHSGGELIKFKVKADGGRSAAKRWRDPTCRERGASQPRLPQSWSRASWTTRTE